MHTCQVGTTGQCPEQPSDEWGPFACHANLQAPTRKSGERGGNEGVK